RGTPQENGRLGDGRLQQVRLERRFDILFGSRRPPLGGLVLCGCRRPAFGRLVFQGQDGGDGRPAHGGQGRVCFLSAGQPEARGGGLGGLRTGGQGEIVAALGTGYAHAGGAIGHPHLAVTERAFGDESHDTLGAWGGRSGLSTGIPIVIHFREGRN